LLLALGHTAHAATIVLNPGESGAPPRIDLDILRVVAQQPTLVPFGTGSFSGLIFDRVLELTDGRFAFETRVMANSAPPPGILKVTRNNFAGFPQVEAAWEDIDVTQSFMPDNVLRSPGSGSTVTFEFTLHPISAHPVGVEPEEWTSNPVVVITDPTAINLVGSFQALGTANVSSFPVNVFSPVPEPQTFAMVGLGLCFAAAIGRRRRAL